MISINQSATLGDYDPEEHKEGYTQDFEDFNLIPKDTRVSKNRTTHTHTHTVESLSNQDTIGSD